MKKINKFTIEIWCKFIERLPDMITIVSPQSGILTAANVNLRHEFQIDKKSVDRYTVFDLFEDSEKNHVRNLLNHTIALKSNDDEDHTQIPLQIRTNPKKYVLPSFKKIDSPSGDFILFILKKFPEKLAHSYKNNALAHQSVLSHTYPVEPMQLYAILDQIAEPIVITDENGKIQYVNSAFEKTTGYSRFEAFGKNPRILNSNLHDQKFYDHLWKTILSGQVWEGYFTNKRKDGRLYQEKATISPIHNQSGNIINFVAVKRDVTQEKRIEQKLRQSQKMEAIGTLAGGIAHDFNNILSAILGYSEIALRDTSTSPSLHNYLQKIFKAGNRARDLVKQILAFSRQTDVEFKPTSISPLVKEVLKLMRASLPSTIKLNQILTTEETIMADPIQIHQVIMNLCTNAGHAMLDHGGTLEVRLENHVIETKSEANFLDVKTGTYVKLIIQDTGIGMDQHIVDSIYDPFFTTKPHGTGMGLSVVHGIVKAHRGAITVSTQKGQGTEFTIFFPAIAKHQIQHDDISPQIAGGHEKILFLDDEVPLTEMSSQMLQRLGYQVKTMTSSLDAYELFKKNPSAFDLVITDLTMPNMTGDIFAQKILEIRPDLPIILCTGYSDTLNESEVAQIGIKAYVTKPLIMKEIAEIVRKVLE